MPRAILKFEQYPGSDFVAAVKCGDQFEYDAKRMEFTFDDVNDPSISGIEYWHDDLELGSLLTDLGFPYVWIEEVDDSRSATVVEPNLSVDFDVRLSDDDLFMVTVPQARDSEYMERVEQADSIFLRIMNAVQEKSYTRSRTSTDGKFHVIEDTVGCIATPHGGISISWSSTDRSAEALADKTARQIVRSVNEREEMMALMKRSAWLLDRTCNACRVTPSQDLKKHMKELRAFLDKAE